MDEKKFTDALLSVLVWQQAQISTLVDVVTSPPRKQPLTQEYLVALMTRLYNTHHDVLAEAISRKFGEGYALGDLEEALLGMSFVKLEEDEEE